MISLALAAVLAASGATPKAQSDAPPTRNVLVRGGEANHQALWDVEDATLDATRPSANSQGDTDLVGGPLRTILIRFGDLDRVIGPFQRVRSAVLVLTTASGDAPRLHTISKVLVPWGEGPFQTLGGFNLPTEPNAKDGQPVAPRGSATWRDRRTGMVGAAWEQPGARGSHDADSIDSAHLTVAGAEIRIDGLAAAVQAMADHPDENHGFAIVLDSAASFSSSESDSGRPRLELELENGPERKGPDLSVTSIEREGPSGKLPVDGEIATYTAHVKNVGDAAAKSFGATWTVDERAGTTEVQQKSLGPGEETTFVYHLPYRPDKTDHRFQTLGLRIHPTGDDANPRNDALTIWTAGKAVEVVISQTDAAFIAKDPNGLGSRSPDDWAQQEAREFNDVYLARSRFSFAPEGVKERVSIQRVIVAEPSSLSIPPSDGSSHAAIPGLTGSVGPNWPTFAFSSRVAAAIGLTFRQKANIPAESNELAGRGGSDRFPGLMGYGDTRFEGLSPGQIELPYEAYSAPIFDSPPIEATWLLAATDVLRLNAALGGPAVAFPRTILLQARNQANLPLAGQTLDFFQTVDGKIAANATPTFTATTDATGNVLLPNRGPSPFGSADPPPGADAFFVRASANGVTDGAWLKAWQAIDTAARGGPGSHAISIMTLHFALPAVPLDPSTNLAADRIVTDSTGMLPAKLAPLLDGSLRPVLLSGKPGDWVEVDLGRDRTIGEIDLFGGINFGIFAGRAITEPGEQGPGPFWSRFDILVYATGQRPEEGAVWGKEVDWIWSAWNRRTLLDATHASVPYRGAAVRVRYIRIINRSSEVGELDGIKVVPVK